MRKSQLICDTCGEQITDKMVVMNHPESTFNRMTDMVKYRGHRVGLEIKMHNIHMGRLEQEWSKLDLCTACKEGIMKEFKGG